MQMKKINLELIVPTDVELPTLIDILFRKGIDNTKLSNENGDIFSVEMSQVIGNTNTLILSTKKDVQQEQVEVR